MVDEIRLRAHARPSTNPSREAGLELPVPGPPVDQPPSAPTYALSAVGVARICHGKRHVG
jgi:hypothetical protein